MTAADATRKRKHPRRIRISALCEKLSVIITISRLLIAAGAAAFLLPAQELRGVIDFHAHSDPDSVPRSIDAVNLAKLAKSRGIRGLVLKNHYEPTASLAYIVRKLVPGIDVFGGIALNRTVGGINAEAVRRMTLVKGGLGRVVWMPTFDAENQARDAKDNRPFVSVSKDGKLLPAVLEVLDVIAKHQLVLATGHSTPEETLQLIREARLRGIKSIIVTHPMIPPVRMSVDQMQEAARLGAKLEFVYNALVGTTKFFEIGEYAAAMRAVGPENIVLSSDLGQESNPLHPDGLETFLKELSAAGFNQAELDLMSKTNPAQLLGLPLSAGAQQLSVGLRRDGSVIQGVMIPAASSQSPTVLLIGGLDGSRESARRVNEEVARIDAMPAAQRKFNLLAIASANENRAPMAFPPAGTAYKENPESNYLWRWIGMRAPDLVIVFGTDDSGLVRALSENSVAGMGTIPAKLVAPQPQALETIGTLEVSPARRELQARLARSPRQLADELEQYYGHDFDQAVYIPAVALIARLRLGHVADVQKIVEPFVTGQKDSLVKPSGSHLSGHLLFGELAERTKDPRYADLVRKAADLGFTDSGAMREAMPLHSEMSDAVFMGCPILAKAGKLTGERKYFDMAQRHFQFMRRLCLRPDGLYRHSPLNEAAWGRGNAFPALGLALTLSDMPTDHPGFGEMLGSLREHLAELSQFQDENGMWRQVIDVPGSYSEFSATAMIGVAMQRAIRRGWIDSTTYQPKVDAAWRAVLARIRDGRIVDVCESTGKQKSLQDYLNRIAILD